MNKYKVNSVLFRRSLVKTVWFHIFYGEYSHGNNSTFVETTNKSAGNKASCDGEIDLF